MNFKMRLTAILLVFSMLCYSSFAETNITMVTTKNITDLEDVDFSVNFEPQDDNNLVRIIFRVKLKSKKFAEVATPGMYLFKGKEKIAHVSLAPMLVQDGEAPAYSCFLAKEFIPFSVITVHCRPDITNPDINYSAESMEYNLPMKDFL